MRWSLEDGIFGFRLHAAPVYLTNGLAHLPSRFGPRKCDEKQLDSLRHTTRREEDCKEQRASDFAKRRWERTTLLYFLGLESSGLCDCDPKDPECRLAKDVFASKRALSSSLELATVLCY